MVNHLQFQCHVSHGETHHVSEHGIGNEVSCITYTYAPLSYALTKFCLKFLSYLNTVNMIRKTIV
jgi:hypothetical protein